MDKKFRDILKKIRQIEVHTSRIVNSVVAGAYHSSYKGQGVEFDEVKEYMPGDDIRSIDWNVTARMNAPFTKRFREERELITTILFDASASNEFGSGGTLKGEVAAELSAVLAFSAIKNNDKVGLIVFSDKVEKYIPPQKGREHVLRVIREVLFFKTKNKKTDINCALSFLNKVQTKKSVCFLISDLIAPDFEHLLRVTSGRHDLTAIKIVDPREMDLVSAGMLEVEDAESGERLMVDSSDPLFLASYRDYCIKKDKEIQFLFKKTNAGFVHLDISRNYISDLVVYFKKKAGSR